MRTGYSRNDLVGIAQGLFACAAHRAARRLDGVATPRGYITETGPLQPVFKATLMQGAADAPSRPTVSPSLRVPALSECFSIVGSFDISLAWPAGTVYGELKAGRTDELGHCAWDALKCATAVARDSALGTMLVAATPGSSWPESALGGELLADREWRASELRERYRDYFGAYQRQDGQFPLRVAAAVRTTCVSRHPFRVDDAPWTLGVARVEPLSSDWFDWPLYDDE